MNKLSAIRAFSLVTAVLGVNVACAWDYEGHRVVNQLALASLPKDFPAFVLTAEGKERIAFLSGEPDRWRNQGSGRAPTDDVVLSHFAGPDHYFDLEYLEDHGMTAESLPIFRYDFTVKLGMARAANPGKFEPIDPEKNKDHSRELIGFAPWAITENCGKLRSAFSYLKAFQNYGGTKDEIANAEGNILYIMGVMGHYVGDCSQPLHATKHHHGWEGPNPNGYTTNSSFHSWIDGGFHRKTGGIDLETLAKRIRPAKIVNDPTKSDDLFRKTVAYIIEAQKLVEPLYQLDKEGKLSPENPKMSEGKEFLGTQLVRGGQMLGDLWFSAWQQAAEDTYLARNLKERQANAAKK